MRLTASEQIAVGVWLALVAATGIMLRSPEAATSTFIVGGICTAVVFATRGRGSPITWVRRLSRAALGVFAIWMVFMSVAMAERLYLVNGSDYPRWLATAELGHVDVAKLKELRATECAHEPVEVWRKQGYAVLRCGFAISQPSTKTYIATSFDF